MLMFQEINIIIYDVGLFLEKIVQIIFDSQSINSSDNKDGSSLFAEVYNVPLC